MTNTNTLAKIFATLGSIVATTACTSSSPSSTPSIAVEDNAAYAANCTAAEGPEQTYDAAQMQQFAIGKWIHCSGPSILDDEQVGIDYEADGTYHMLGDDGAGNLVDLNGFGNQGTWDISADAPDLIGWYTHPDPASGIGGYPTVETGPRKFQIWLGEADDGSIYAIAP
jgi:hypothetical protein